MSRRCVGRTDPAPQGGGTDEQDRRIAARVAEHGWTAVGVEDHEPPFDALEDVPLAVRPVHPTQHEGYLGYAMAYCRHRGDIGKLSAVQVFWPDEQGRFPFEPDCDPDVVRAQPRLDVPIVARPLT